MGRKKFREEDKKSKLSITINRILYQIIYETIDNKSKYVEWLISQDLNNNIKNV